VKLPKYEYMADENLDYFEFLSIGLKGQIKKVVQFSKLNEDGFYNLAFGDYNEVTNQIDDKVVTNNGDSLIILRTVASTVFAFTDKYPNAIIFATGSTEIRTRLYRMGLSNNLDEITIDFEVYGVLENGNVEPFIIGEDYFGFIVKRKKLK